MESEDSLQGEVEETSKAAKFLDETQDCFAKLADSIKSESSLSAATQEESGESRPDSTQSQESSEEEEKKELSKSE